MADTRRMPRSLIGPLAVAAMLGADMGTTPGSAFDGEAMDANEREAWKRRLRIANSEDSHAQRLAAAQAKRARRAASRQSEAKERKDNG